MDFQSIVVELPLFKIDHNDRQWQKYKYSLYRTYK